MSPDNLKSGDTDDLEALFDEIAEQKVWESDSEEDEPEIVASATLADEPTEQPEDKKIPSANLIKANSDDPRDVFQRVGLLTRKLHDALRELGYDKSVEAAVSGLPDARARLTYIANLTGEAANKVLASIEKCQTINDDIGARAQKMDEAWERLFNNDMSLEEFKAHAKESHEFVKAVRDQSGILGSEFTEIMMAQDFHDLTGQVVNRIATMAQNLEEQLVQLLLDTTPAEQRKQVEEQWLTGPAMNIEGRTDVCSDQTQVDDLLESLGF
ncbi:MAG: protein phosphatase CheZ [Limnobacter sp.]|nr:protein phosphatase CheZ [Limnobacter sp.]